MDVRWFRVCSVCVAPRLTSSRTNNSAIHDNQLTGSIPNGIGRLQQLEWFVAFNNQLSGTLPEDLGQCRKLRQLYGVSAHTLHTC